MTEHLPAEVEINWATLATELGYAHFAADFKEMFGEPPTGYAQRY